MGPGGDECKWVRVLMRSCTARRRELKEDAILVVKTSSIHNETVECRYDATDTSPTPLYTEWAIT